jgi:hypothetical protein
LPTKSGVKYLNFSACGTQIVVKFCGRFNPEVMCIKSDPVYQWALQQSQDSSNNYNVASQKQKNTQITTSNSFELAVGPRSTSLALGQVVVNDSSSHKVVISRNASQRVVQVMYRSGKDEEVQSLVSLPSWAGVDNIDITVHAPTTREERINNILNKAAQPWYSLSDPQDVHLPAVVRKDTRAIGPLRKRDARGKLVDHSLSYRSESAGAGVGALAWK